MSDWTPELTAEVVRLYTKDAMTCGEIARFKGMSRSQVGSKLNRLGVIGSKPKKRDYDENRIRLRRQRARVMSERAVLDRGSWDEKLFEPWEVRKARLARERSQGQQQ